MFQALKNEMRQASSLLRRIGLLSEKDALGANFRRFGPEFGAYDYDEFETMARDFYTEGKDSDDPYYTIVEMSDNRVAIDYNGEKRGVYDKSGNPLAFFRPNFHQLGYNSKSQELDAFRSGYSEIG